MTAFLISGIRAARAQHHDALRPRSQLIIVLIIVVFDIVGSVGFISITDIYLIFLRYRHARTIPFYLLQISLVFLHLFLEFLQIELGAVYFDL